MINLTNDNNFIIFENIIKNYQNIDNFIVHNSNLKFKKNIIYIISCYESNNIYSNCFFILNIK